MPKPTKRVHGKPGESGATGSDPNSGGGFASPIPILNPTGPTNPNAPTTGFAASPYTESVSTNSGPADPSISSPNSLSAHVLAGRAAGVANGEKWLGTAETGKNIDNVLGQMGDRVNGSDPTTQALMQQKQQSQALAARGMAGRGLAGGVATAAIEQAGRMKDVDIAAQAYTQNAANLKDYANINSNIAASKGVLEESAIASEIAAIPPPKKKGRRGIRL